MKFFDWFRKSREERIRKQAEERREERLAEELKEKMDEHEAWLAEVNNRYFKKNDLVCFVQFGYESSDDNTYFMCGYLNGDGSRFKDIATGDIYDVTGAPYPTGNKLDALSETIKPTINVNGRPFAKVNGCIIDSFNLILLFRMRAVIKDDLRRFLTEN